MTYVNANIKAGILAFSTVIVMGTGFAAHAANPQDDVKFCREAMTVQSDIDISEYRLRFERSVGQRGRTVYLKAIPKKGGQSFRFSCQINRTEVLALNRLDDTIQLAWSK